MSRPKPLTVDEIAALNKECSIHQFDSWVWGRMAALIATVERQAEQIEKLRADKREIENAAFERAAQWCEREDIERDPDDLYSGRKHRAAAIRAFIQPPAQKGRT